MKLFSLKTLRVVLALLFVTPLVLFFVDFSRSLPTDLHFLAHIQLVPAVMIGSVAVVALWVLLTLLFGRVYCSTVCPMGILQDVFNWFTRRGKRKNKKRRWFKYHPATNWLRYGLLSICVLGLLIGITTPLLLFDPYSNFGRIAVNLFRPIVMEGNNLLSWIALQFDNYSFYHVTIYTITSLSFVMALLALLLVGVMSLLRGRLFCNTICPVGSFLGILSKFSVFRITVDHSKCNSCGLCEKSCKAECIDSKAKTVDSSRCVSCYNCLNSCQKKQAIGYRFVYAKNAQPKEESKPTMDTGRRKFLIRSTAIAASVPVLPALAQPTKEIDITKLTPITPPGSRSLKHFKAKCTACHLCITHCPQQILKPAGFNFGLNYAFKPQLFFYEKGFCNYSCTVCSDVCPNGAIEKITEEEKKLIQIGVVKFNEDLCIVKTEGTSCGACSEHCPTKAVSMKPYGDEGLTLPVIEENLCIGCGGCESICPVRPIKAINILANEVHQTAEAIPEEEVEDVDLDQLDWGF